MAATESTMVAKPTICIVGPMFTLAPPAVASLARSNAPSSSTVKVGRLNCSARIFSQIKRLAWHSSMAYFTCPFTAA